MKRVTFTKLSIQNFFSAGPVPIEIDFQSGFNLITGTNKDENDIKNGVGKSLVIDALYFAIFGDTLRELSNKSFIINRQIGKDCKVILDFDQVSTKHDKEHFTIERSISKTYVKVFKNGVDKTKATAAETNKYIKEVLSANEEIFQNCVIMRANNAAPFMQKKKIERKNFIESIFNLSIFSDMLKDVKDDLKQAKHDYDISNTELDGLVNNKLKYEREIERLQQEADTRLKQAQSIVNKIKDEINEHKNQIVELGKELEKKDILLDNLEKTQQAKQQADGFMRKILQDKYRIDAQISSAKKQLQKIEQHGTVCPTCKREYDEAHKSHIEASKTKLEQDIASSQEEYSKTISSEMMISGALEEINNRLSLFNQNINQLKLIQSKIKGIEDLIASKEQQIKIVTTQNDDSALRSFNELLGKAVTSLIIKKDEVKDKEHEITKLNICEHILGEYGIKAYIVNKLLELLNNRIAFYLDSFKSTFDFRFNELFEDEIKDSSGAICSYGNCSGAEMKKIDLAISFAFMDILRYHQGLEYNLMFFDEILDSSLDTKSLEHVIQFINEYTLQNDKAVYLITHKSDIALGDINQTILLEKEDGFTRLVSQN